MLDWYWYLLLVVAGFLAGIINTIAGGGSFLTLPALMFVMGMDPKLANGTNRVAILFSSGAAALTFRRHGHLDTKTAKRLTLPTLLGVPPGSLLAVYLPPDAFDPIFGAVFLLMAVVLAMDPKRILSERESATPSPRFVTGVFFCIGVYVGFIQAGMGVLLLLGMSMLKTGDLVASNAIKNLIGFLVTLVATLVFCVSGLVDWVPGLVMASGNVMGGFAGAKLAIRKGNRLIFWFVVVVMIVTGIKLLFFGQATQ